MADHVRTCIVISLETLIDNPNSFSHHTIAEILLAGSELSPRPGTYERALEAGIEHLVSIGREDVLEDCIDALKKPESDFWDAVV